MSRRRSRRSRSRRVTPRNANRRLPTANYYFTSVSPSSDFLTQVEDRRDFHPAPHVRPARSFFKSFHRLSLPQQTSLDDLWDVPTRVAFEQPHHVLVCVRRKMRKEVLHALKKAGRRGQKAPRRSAYSDIQC